MKLIKYSNNLVALKADVVEQSSDIGDRESIPLLSILIKQKRQFLL